MAPGRRKSREEDDVDVPELDIPGIDVEAIMAKSTVSALDTRAVPTHVPREAKKQPSKWYEIPKPEMTQELKDDLQVVHMRSVIDRKRFYKSSDYKKKAVPSRVQVGTVIEGPTEYTSGRIPRKERRKSMVAELMADETVRKYAKRKHLEVQEATQRGGKKARTEKLKSRKPKWSRARH